MRDRIAQESGVIRKERACSGVVGRQAHTILFVGRKKIAKRLNGQDEEQSRQRIALLDTTSREKRGLDVLIDQQMILWAGVQ